MLLGMRRRLYVLAATISPLLSAASAMAAQTGVPPDPSLRKGPAAWMGFGMMFVLFGVVVAISLMPSKRGHQD